MGASEKRKRGRPSLGERAVLILRVPPHVAASLRELARFRCVTASLIGTVALERFFAEIASPEPPEPAAPSPAGEARRILSRAAADRAIRAASMGVPRG